MMKKALALLVLLVASPAVAQWQVPLGTIPIGRGPGVIGFNSIAPSGLTFGTNVALFGAISNDNTKAVVNQTAFNAAYAANGDVFCSSGTVYYVQKITIPVTATSLKGCNLIAAGTYAGSDGVVSVINNTVGFTFQGGSVSANGTTYPTTAAILINGSTNTRITESSFPAAARTIVSANNTNLRILYNTITSYVYNVVFDSGGSNGVWIEGNRASGGTDTGLSVWDDTAFIVVSPVGYVSMRHNVTTGVKLWAYSVQNTSSFDISHNIANGGVRECITAGTSYGVVSNNLCVFDSVSTDYCMSFAASYIDISNNNCVEPNYTGMYVFNGLGGSIKGNSFSTPPTTTNLGTGWTVLYIEGTTTGLTVADNSVYDKYGTLSWYYWRVSGSPTGNFFYTPVGPTPSQGVFGNGLNVGVGNFYTQNLNVFGTISGGATIITPSFTFGAGAASTIQAISTNTGFANTFVSENNGTPSSTGTIAVIGAALSATPNAFLQILAAGGASPSGKIESGSALTGGLNIVADAGTLSLTTPTLTNATVTGSFTATGLVANASLATMATNTVKGNATSGTASPTNLAMPSCSTSSSVLQWTTNTGFNCNTSPASSSVPLSGITGLGTGVATALALNVGSAGAPVTFNGAGGTPSSITLTNASGTAASLTAGNVTTNANLTGDVTSVGNATTLTNAPVIAKVLTGFTSGAGTVSATDSILSAFQKINGNDALKAPINNATFTGTFAVPAGSLSTAALTGTLAAAQEPAHTGDVTNTAGSLTLAIANNAVTLAKLATQATNTVLGNATSGTAVPTALAVGSCDTATKALQWTTNTGFGCNSSITAAAIAVGGITGLGAGAATWLATPSSANLAAAVTDETGSGPLVFGTSPTITSPTLSTFTIPTTGSAPHFQCFTSGSTCAGFWFSDAGHTAADQIFFGADGAVSNLFRVGFFGTGGIGSNVVGVSGATGSAFMNVNGSLGINNVYSTTPANTLYVNGSSSFNTTSTTGAAFNSSGTVYMASLTADTATLDRTICQSTTTNQILTGTGTLGICLGTSGRQFKTDFAPMIVGIDEVMKIDFQNYHYRKGFGDDGARLQYGTTAQDVAGVIPDLVRYDIDGNAINYDSGALLFIGLRSIQQLKIANDNFEARLVKLENHK